MQATEQLLTFRFASVATALGVRRLWGQLPGSLRRLALSQSALIRVEFASLPGITLSPDSWIFRLLLPTQPDTQRHP